MQSTTITNLRDFIDWTSNVSAELRLIDTTLDPLFRGQADARWALVPGIYRAGSHLAKNEREMLRDFKAFSGGYLDSRSPTNADWMFLAQHYGLPTRLLDWTSNALVALFFCCEDYKNTSDGAVWALNAWRINEVSLSLRSMPACTSDSFQQYVLANQNDDFARTISPTLPMAVRQTQGFERSISQSGYFTAHGSSRDGLEKFPFGQARENCLIKCTISGINKLKILRELYNTGIHHQTLFNTLEAVSKRVHFRHCEDFYKTTGTP